MYDEYTLSVDGVKFGDLPKFGQYQGRPSSPTTRDRSGSLKFRNMPSQPGMPDYGPPPPPKPIKPAAAPAYAPPPAPSTGGQQQGSTPDDDLFNFVSSSANNKASSTSSSTSNTQPKSSTANTNSKPQNDPFEMPWFDAFDDFSSPPSDKDGFTKQSGFDWDIPSNNSTNGTTGANTNNSNTDWANWGSDPFFQQPNFDPFASSSSTSTNTNKPQQNSNNNDPFRFSNSDPFADLGSFQFGGGNGKNGGTGEPSKKSPSLDDLSKRLANHDFDVLAEKDLYRILGVSVTASAEEINYAYKILRARFHPDQGTAVINDAVAKYQKLRDAYTILSDEVRYQSP